MAWPSVRYKTAANGGTWTPTDMNGVEDQFLRTNGILASDLDPAVVKALGLNDGVKVRRGSSIISAAGSRSVTTYGALSNGPDQVANVVLETNGWLEVDYQAVWYETVSGAANAAIFLNSTALDGSSAARMSSSLPGVTATIGGVAAQNVPLSTCYTGLISANAVTGGYVGDDGALGVSFGIAQGGTGTCKISAPAGTYTVSVQFKASSGFVQVQNRTLRVASFLD